MSGFGAALRMTSRGRDQNESGACSVVSFAQITLCTDAQTLQKILMKMCEIDQIYATLQRIGVRFVTKSGVRGRNRPNFGQNSRLSFDELLRKERFF